MEDLPELRLLVDEVAEQELDHLQLWSTVLDLEAQMTIMVL